jgi:hypothetical protein
MERKVGLFFTRQKKGTHVGFVLSFVLFVFSLLFIYALFGPQITSLLRNPTDADSIKDNLIKDVSNEVTVVTVKFSSDDDCLGDLFEKVFGSSNIDDKFIVKDSNDNLVEAGFSGENIKIARGGNDFFKIYFSDAFEADSNPSCSGVDSDYSVGVKKERIVFQSKVEESVGSEEELFGDFASVGFVYNNGTEIRTRDEFPNVNVFVSEYPVRYFSNDRDILSGGLKVYTW